ncbi:hypothetical protein O1M54_43415 [Streptomyces diastatochromogenes]|nr:hypothetical protein [Streptomyces diastatochromogenes]
MSCCTPCRTRTAWARCEPAASRGGESAAAGDRAGGGGCGAEPRTAGAGAVRPGGEGGQATPGWLRYATLDADRRRTEAIDPATLVDRLANSVVRSLRGDPEDLSKRTRKQLAGLPEELLDQVLDRLENRLLGSEQDRVLDLVDDIDAYDDFADDRVERDAHDAPEIEPDTAEEIQAERDSTRRDDAEERARKDKPETAPGPEKDRTDHEARPEALRRTAAPARSSGSSRAPRRAAAEPGRPPEPGSGSRRPPDRREGPPPRRAVRARRPRRRHRPREPARGSRRTRAPRRRATSRAPRQPARRSPPLGTAPEPPSSSSPASR